MKTKQPDPKKKAKASASVGGKKPTSKTEAKFFKKADRYLKMKKTLDSLEHKNKLQHLGKRPSL